jgi:hypothetical protein
MTVSNNSISQSSQGLLAYTIQAGGLINLIILCPIVPHIRSQLQQYCGSDR